MNIAFHYYAIKAVAAFAGLPDREAQIIAEYSQFIDDYSTRDTIYTNWAPQDLVEAGVVKKKADRKFEIPLITTGFVSMWETAQLVSSDFRNRMLIPFHFILPRRMVPENFTQVVEQAGINDNQIISELLRRVCQNVQTAPQRSQRDLQLMYLGMVLHTFCDTYAHQGFSGHRQDSNGYKITRVLRQAETSLSDVTAQYSSAGFVPYHKFPNIGHCTVGHVPDDTYLNFRLEKPDHGTYERSNLLAFIDLCGILFPLFQRCSGNPVPSFEDIRLKLRSAFMLDNDATARLAPEWTRIFADEAISFHYDREEILLRLAPGLRRYNNEEALANNTFCQEETAKIAKKMLSPDQAATSLSTYWADVTPEFFTFTMWAYQMRRRAVDDQYLD
ncbi:MAG: hypothetical protein RRY14_08020 [Hydrogenoanaerobacterium sp.]